MRRVETAVAPSRIQRLVTWAHASPVNTSVCVAIVYVVTQPLMLPLVYMSADAPLGFTSIAMWLRFELTELCLGCLVGTIVYHSRRWRRRSWARDWAESAISTFALGAATTARELPRMSTDRWIALVLLSGALLGALFALTKRGLRRVGRAAGIIATERPDCGTSID
jgi:hypothetical protein